MASDLKTFLVTGSEGNVGWYVVAALQKKFPSARVIRVRRQNRAAENPGPMLYTGDLRNHEFIQKIFAENKIYCVVHLAARTYNAIDLRDKPYDVFANDTECLLTMLDGAKDIKRFIYASSLLVYESVDAPTLREEESVKSRPPATPLGLAKYLGERAVELYHAETGVPYTIWRPFNVVSPLESHERPGGHVFIDLYRKVFVEHAPKIELWGGGEQKRCFTWVEDIAGGIVDFIEDERTNNETFNIGSREARSVRDVLELFLRLGRAKGALPKGYHPEVVGLGPSPASDTRDRAPDVGKIERMLGWQCRTDFQTCFEKFIASKLKQKA